MTCVSTFRRLTPMTAGAITALGAISSAHAADAIRHRIVELGSLPGGITQPYALNNQSQVTGSSGAASINQGGMHVFRWDMEESKMRGLEDTFEYSVGSVISENGTVAGYGCMFPNQSCAGQILRFLPDGTMEIVGTLGGQYGNISDINATGAFVGEWRVAQPQFSSHAFLVDEEGTLMDLGTLGGNSSYAHAINDANQVVGYAWTKTTYRAFLWDNGVMTDLGSLGGTYSKANDINNHSAVVGFAQGPDLNAHAFLYTPDAGMIDLHPQLPDGATSSYAMFINDAGMVLIEYFDSQGMNQLARWSEADGVIELGQLPIASIGVLPAAMNADGMVVGTFHDEDYQSIPFLWTPERGMVNLGSTLLASPDWQALTVSDANDLGQILITGWDVNHFTGALLEPVGTGDLDGDGDVDFDDLVQLLANWGACVNPDGPCPADYNSNGEVDFDDMVTLLANWN